MKKPDVIVLCGGFGTRLSSVLKDLPKPMAPVSGKPFLYYILKKLEAEGFRRFILSTGYLGDKISARFGEKSGEADIVYAREKEPLGTGGGIRYAMQYCSSGEVLVMNGDTFFDIPLNTFVEMHRREKADVSIALKKVDDCSRYGFVETDDKGRITAFREKKEGKKDCFINGGIYTVNRKTFMDLPLGEKFSMEKDFFQKYVNSLIFKGFPFDNYFIDIGIPEDYEKAQSDFKGFKY